MTSHAKTAVDMDTRHTDLSCMVSVHGNMYRGRMIRPTSRSLQDYAVVEMGNSLKLFPISCLKFGHKSQQQNSDTLCPVTSTKASTPKPEERSSTDSPEVDEEIDVIEVGGPSQNVKSSEPMRKDETSFSIRPKKPVRRRKPSDLQPLPTSHEKVVTQTTKKALRNVCLRRKMRNVSEGVHPYSKRVSGVPSALTKESVCQHGDQSTARRMMAKSAIPRTSGHVQQRPSAFSPVNLLPINPLNVLPRYQSRPPYRPPMNTTPSCNGPPVVCSTMRTQHWATNRQFFEGLPNCNSLLPLPKPPTAAMQAGNSCGFVPQHLPPHVGGHQCSRAGSINSMANLLDGYAQLLRSQAASAGFGAHVGGSGGCPTMPPHPSMYQHMDGHVWPPGPIWR